MYESSARRPRQPAAYKNQHFYHSFGHQTSTKWRERCAGHFKICVSPQFWTSDEHETTRGLREDPGRFAFHLSFGRPTSTKWREGCDDDVQTSHFTSVLDVRRPRSDERVATASFKIRMSPQFWTSDDHEVTRGLRGDLKNSHFTTVSDVRRARSDERVVSRLDRPNPPCVKKRKKF